MFTRVRFAGALGLALATVLLGSPGVTAQEDEKKAAKDEVKALDRGPIHEAFAQPYEMNPTATPIVSQKPPEPVVEEPPDQKPEGDNVQWIAGYWTWEPEQKEYIWVSGFWRVAPPKRKWVPGHWSQADKGWQWVAGFWGPADQEKIEYLPEPPDSLDRGPKTAAPDQESVYEPGMWVYED